MQKNVVETFVGVLVVAALIGFIASIYTWSRSHSDNINGYDLTASFKSADGISAGTDITLHGVKIGTVSSVSLDPKTYLPVVHLSIRNGIRIPDDSTIKFTSSGLLGDYYLAIEPGSSDKFLVAHASIKATQGGAGLGDLINRITKGGLGSK